MILNRRNRNRTEPGRRRAKRERGKSEMGDRPSPPRLIYGLPAFSNSGTQFVRHLCGTSPHRSSPRAANQRAARAPRRIPEGPVGECAAHIWPHLPPRAMEAAIEDTPAPAQDPRHAPTQTRQCMYWQQTVRVSTASENNQGNAQVQGRDNRCNAERCVETVRYAQLSAESVNYYSIAARVVVSCRESLITSTVKRWEMEGHVAGGGITG